MTDVITVVDSTLATQAQSTQVVQAGYIAQTVSSSGGNAASTVTDETSYGISKAVGSSTAYAREDHTHGSPSLGTTSLKAAAGNHNHSGVYDASGAATAALTTAEAYTDAAVTARTPRIVAARVTTGDVTLPNTSGAWQALAGFELDISAAVGDWVEIAVSGMSAPSSSSFLEVAVIVAGSLVRYMSTGTGSPATEGDPSMYPQPSQFRTFGFGVKGFTVTSGDLDGGSVRFVLAVRAAGAGTLYSSASYPFYWQAKNLRAVL